MSGLGLRGQASFGSSDLYTPLPQEQCRPSAGDTADSAAAAAGCTAASRPFPAHCGNGEAQDSKAPRAASLRVYIQSYNSVHWLGV